MATMGGDVMGVVVGMEGEEGVGAEMEAGKGVWWAVRAVGDKESRGEELNVNKRMQQIIWLRSITWDEVVELFIPMNRRVRTHICGFCAPA